MEALIIKNLKDVKLTIRGRDRMMGNLVLKSGEQHLFPSPKHYFNYKEQIEKLIRSKFVVVETIKQVSKTPAVSGFSVTKDIVRDHKVEDATLVTASSDEGNSEEPTSDSSESELVAAARKEDLIAEMKAKQDLYKKSSKEDKKKLKEEILAIKEEISKL